MEDAKQMILSYIAATYRANPDAEVSGPELQHELGLDEVLVARYVRELAAEGLVDWDPLLSNTWLRLTDKGLSRAGR